MKSNLVDIYRDANAPLVSAVIPAFDAAPYLARAIRSVLAQTYVPLEIIIIDDGSQDGTHRVAKRFNGPLQIIRLPHTRGVATARNVGIEAARGQYIAFLDADDEWLPEKTAKQISVMAQAAEMTLIGCVAELVKRDHVSMMPEKGLFVPGQKAWKSMLTRSLIAASGVIARRADLLDLGGFDTKLAVAEDQDLWIRLARLGHVGFLDEVLARCYDTPRSLTKRHRSSAAALTLAVVERNITAAGDELTRSERRQIRRQRLARLGRTSYEEGNYLSGLVLLIRAILLGHEPIRNMVFLAHASPALSSVKRLLRRYAYSAKILRNSVDRRSSSL